MPKASLRIRFDIREEAEKGIVEEVPEGRGGSNGYFLPHRGVFKENANTTLRPVSDTLKHRDISVNEYLSKVPKLSELLSSVLLRFREKSIGVISNITEAFLQVSVTDWDYLKFVW